MKYTIIASAIAIILTTGYVVMENTNTNMSTESESVVTQSQYQPIRKQTDGFSSWGKNHNFTATPTRQMAGQSESVYAPKLPDQLVQDDSQYIAKPIKLPLENLPKYIPGVEYTPTGDGYGVPDNVPSTNFNFAFGGSSVGETNSAASTSTTVVGKNGINYYNGPVITSSANVYFIWYGNWTNNTATTILPNFVKNISGSSYMNIASSYTDSNGKKGTSIVNYINSTSVGYTKGKDGKGNPLGLGVVDVAGVVNAVIKAGTLPKDTNGVYVVMTSADVPGTDGFCNNFCGYHNSYTYSPTFNYKFIFSGNTDRCSLACGVVKTTGVNTPNGNSGADGMINILAHELIEYVTDPQFNGWHTSKGDEVGDLCSWNFGPEYKTKSGAAANVHLGTSDYMIQQEWLNANGGKCVMSYN
jgi:hypothetical protein